MKHSLRLALLALGLGGCHAGLGPVLGYRFDDDARIGWEASGGFAVARASVGQAFSYGDQGDTEFYAAAEPGIVVGATLGTDYDSKEGWGFMPGGWVGVPCYQQQDRRYDFAGKDWDLFGTVALGYRYAHGHEIYVAPKLFLLEQISLGGH